MIQSEYEQKRTECWEEFCKDPHLCDSHSLTKSTFNFAFDRAYALGKQEKEAEETVISGWVARDSDGTLSLFAVKPERVRYRRRNGGLWMAQTMTDLIPELFPDLTWDDDPIEVELIIKRKKKNL